MGILINNKRWLNLYFRDIAEMVKEENEKEPTGDVVCELTKTGLPTLRCKTEVGMKYIHSKYDPNHEAERLISKYNQGKPVLFFGVGLGYHIEHFIKQYPGVRFAIYEPNKEVLLHFLKRIELSNWNNNNLLGFIVDSSNLKEDILKISVKANHSLIMLDLPVVSEIYIEQYAEVMNTLKEISKERKGAISAEVAHQVRWITNAIKNVPKVVSTPNMIVDIEKQHFKNKPAIIVSAGPSLNREFETLRKIKEEGRAYIFAVGSAIKALLAQNIYPDIVCTYDPKAINYKVFQEIKERNIKNIPMLFGSSVGYETIDDYPSSLYHILTSQDSVISEILGEDYPYVNDAPTVAVVAYQVLLHLEVEPIILVGQNLAYLNQNRHAKGVAITEEENLVDFNKLGSELVEVLDVNGNKIFARDRFVSMREQLEMYIRVGRRTINTTVDGANIEGTEFIKLEELLNNELNEPNIVSNWETGNNSYDKKRIKNQLIKLTKEVEKTDKSILNIQDKLNVISKKIELRNLVKIEDEYGELDKLLAALRNNKFYISFVEPMIRVQYENLVRLVEDTRYETDRFKKGTQITLIFKNYLTLLNEYSDYAKNLFYELKELVNKDL